MFRSGCLSVALLLCAAQAMAQGPIVGTTGTFSGNVTSPAFSTSGSSSYITFGSGAFIVGGLNASPISSAQITTTSVASTTFVTKPSFTVGSTPVDIFHENTTISGTSSGQVIINLFQATSETVTTPVGLTFFQITNNFGGATVTGSRQGLVVNQALTATTGNNYTGGAEYVALQANGFAGANDGGTGVTAGTAQGVIFGFNPGARLKNGATNYTGVVGQETDIEVDSGASVMDKLGLTVGLDLLDAIPGARDDVAIDLNNAVRATATQGWSVGIGIGRHGGNAPILTGGTVMAAIPNANIPTDAGTVGIVFDFSLMTATNYFIKGPQSSFTVNGSGNVVAPSIGNGNGYFQISGAGQWTANGSVATSLTSLGPSGAHTAVQEWLTFKDNSGNIRYIPAF